MNNKIVGYGELLLRLTPVEYGGLVEQSEALKMGFAGAEANIIADLALLGHATAFVTAFPQNPVGRKANQFLQRYGIDSDSVIWNNGRLGTYYIEHGTSIRGSRVTYDREDSLVTKTTFTTAEWETILQGASYFILTGVTPALSAVCQQTIANALQVCKSLDVKVVFDLNYRRTLWTKEEAKKSFESILPFVNILIGNVGSAYDVFDIKTAEADDYTSLKLSTQQAADALSQLGNFDWIAMTMRLQTNANDNELGGMIKEGNDYFFSPSIETKIIDRLGGGDAFAAAVLHGIIKNWPDQKIVNFANAAFAITQTLHGDINYISEQELRQVASGSVKGHVMR